VFGRAKSRPSTPVAEPPAPVEVRPLPEPLAASLGARRVVRWCEVERVLARRCQRCHTIPPRAGAPFPLLAFSDTQREYPPSSGQPIVARMAHVIRHRVMPPTHMLLDPPVLPLERDEVDVLLVWLEEGALPFGGVECGATESHTAESTR